ncbi:glycosyltransferase [Endozoicomonas atrinae]|uniref:glycosyltransferase n=1 Tax=Endozoicomonas atrinae TaxID=1333660 RepID=UPI003AFFBC58
MYEFTFPIAMIKQAKQSPRISIVTATYNSIQYIHDLVESVKKQSHTLIDFIVIDGGSTDGTLEYLTQCDNISSLVSEPDEGIYDALNKGLNLCRDNSFIIILGSDDELLDLNPFVEIIESNSSITNIICDVVQRDIDTNIKSHYKCWLPGKTAHRDFLKFPLHHQGFITKKNESMGLFKLDIGLHADLLFMMQRLRSGRSVKADTPLAIYRTGGASDKFTYRNIISIYKVSRILNISFCKAVLSNPVNMAKLIIKAFSPSSIIQIIRSKISRACK